MLYRLFAAKVGLPYFLKTTSAIVNEKVKLTWSRCLSEESSSELSLCVYIPGFSILSKC